MRAQMHKKQFNFLTQNQFSFIPKISECFPMAEVFLVGGSVRDILMGRTPDEYDIVVRGVPPLELEAFLTQLGHVDFVGRVFGVFKFRPAGSDRSFDIALPRTDHAWGTGGYRDADVQSDHTLPIKRDLERRDFTINAIALKINSKFKIRDSKFSLIDPFKGQADIKKKIIRTVGLPQNRFAEDYSRMLRALRFSAQLGFSIEKKTWNALVTHMPHINDTYELNAHSPTANDSLFRTLRGKAGTVPRQALSGGALPKRGAQFRSLGGTSDSEKRIPSETVAKEFLKSLSCDPLTTMDLWDASGTFRELVPELLAMKGCPQPPEYHSEGDVWTHTRLCFEKLLSDDFKKEFPPSFLPHQAGTLEFFCEHCLRQGLTDCSCSGAEVSQVRFPTSVRKSSLRAKNTNVPAVHINLLLAILFHDIGKPPTLKTPEKHGTDRIRFDGHDQIGAEIFLSIAERLKLAAPEHFGCDPTKTSWIIKNHMLLVSSKVESLRNTTIEKYFFNPLVPGNDLLKLLWCDASASIPNDGSETLNSFHALKARIKVLQQIRGPGLPPPLLNGNEIMDILKLKPGKKVGNIIEQLREEQLKGSIKTKTAAIYYIKRETAS